jgi:hypothetical protein
MVDEHQTPGSGQDRKALLNNTETPDSETPVQADDTVPQEHKVKHSIIDLEAKQAQQPVCNPLNTSDHNHPPETHGAFRDKTTHGRDQDCRLVIWPQVTANRHG